MLKSRYYGVTVTWSQARSDPPELIMCSRLFFIPVLKVDRVQIMGPRVNTLKTTHVNEESCPLVAETPGASLASQRLQSAEALIREQQSMIGLLK